LIGRVDPATGEIVPTDGRNRKNDAVKEENKDMDYQKLYEQLLKKHAALESLYAALQKETKQSGT
jgi:hypothetical protein